MQPALDRSIMHSVHDGRRQARLLSDPSIDRVHSKQK
jgi:hypothetical protein